MELFKTVWNYIKLSTFLNPSPYLYPYYTCFYKKGQYFTRIFDIIWHTKKGWANAQPFIYICVQFSALLWTPTRDSISPSIFAPLFITAPLQKISATPQNTLQSMVSASNAQMMILKIFVPFVIIITFLILLFIP